MVEKRSTNAELATSYHSIINNGLGLSNREKYVQMDSSDAEWMHSDTIERYSAPLEWALQNLPRVLSVFFTLQFCMGLASLLRSTAILYEELNNFKKIMSSLVGTIMVFADGSSCRILHISACVESKSKMTRFSENKEAVPHQHGLLLLQILGNSDKADTTSNAVIRIGEIWESCSGTVVDNCSKTFRTTIGHDKAKLHSISSSFSYMMKQSSAVVNRNYYMERGLAIDLHGIFFYVSCDDLPKKIETFTAVFFLNNHYFLEL